MRRIRMSTILRCVLLALALAPAPLIVACADAAEDCHNLGTCPLDGGADAGSDGQGGSE
jgi:hypothetical protein